MAINVNFNGATILKPGYYGDINPKRTVLVLFLYRLGMRWRFE